MKTIEESVVTAMDGESVEIFSYLPYILQDIWEIGANPEQIIEIIQKRIKNPAAIRILDLGSGKGAVSIKLAKALGCRCLGIDAIPEFVEYARKKSLEYGVEGLCEFIVGDIRSEIDALRDFDGIILGAIGPVLGNHYETLSRLSPSLSENGFIIIDDGYLEDGSNFSHPLISEKSVVQKQIHDAGMEIVEEFIYEKDYLIESDEMIFEHLKRRCEELMERHPDKRALFLDYIAKQEEENDIIENRIVNATLFIQKTGRGSL